MKEGIQISKYWMRLVVAGCHKFVFHSTCRAKEVDAISALLSDAVAANIITARLTYYDAVKGDEVKPGKKKNAQSNCKANVRKQSGFPNFAFRVGTITIQGNSHIIEYC